MNLTVEQIAQSYADYKNFVDKSDEKENQQLLMRNIMKQRSFVNSKIIDWLKNYNVKLNHQILDVISNKNKDLDQLFENLKTISVENYGFDNSMFTTKYKNDNIISGDIFVKIFNKTFSRVSLQGKGDNLIESYISMMLQTLGLRNFIPIYSIFVYGPPIKLNNKEYLWGFNKNKYVYILTEYKKYAKEIRNITSFLNSKQLIEVLIQIACTLRQAKIKFNFSHNDLHSRNVMVDKFNKLQSIELHTSRGIKIIKTYYVAYIIDFGTSSINLEDGKKIGMNYASGIGVEDAQITQDFLFLVVELIRGLIRKQKIDDICESPDEWKFYQFTSEEKKQNEMDNLNLLKNITKFYLKSDVENIISVTNNWRLFQFIPRFGNEIEEFDKIIDGMFKMK